MVEFRKLLITKNWGTLPPEEKVISLEEAREYMRNYWPSSAGWLPVFVVVEGQVVHSYDELIKVVSQDDFKKKAVINIELLPITGGG